MKPHIFHSITYPSNHWAMHYPLKTDTNFIARIQYKSNDYVVKINPTDSRGYRSIVGLVHPDMQTTCNRHYILSEKIGLQMSLAVVAQAYENLGLIAQIEVACNNSHSFRENQVILGSDKEPSLLHGHIIGRGDPNHEYISGVPLRGPIPGELFNMRGDDPKINGNDKKITWIPEHMENVRTSLKTQLKKMFDTPLELKWIE